MNYDLFGVFLSVVVRLIPFAVLLIILYLIFSGIQDNLEMTMWQIKEVTR